MTKERQHTGRTGEEIACDFLKEQGYSIVERNYRSRIGEIDIVTEHREYLVFCEVKTRRNLTGLHPSLSVTAKKIEKWLNSIKCPTKLSQLNISEDEFTKIIKNILYEIDNELRYMDNKSLKKFAFQHCPEKKNLDTLSKIKKFEEKRLFQILNLCK